MNTQFNGPAEVVGTVGSAPVLVRELASKDREQMLTHFLSLDEEDRLLRFGQMVPDHVIENYVRTIDFGRDTVFGVFDHDLELIGVGHLAYLPAGATSARPNSACRCSKAHAAAASARSCSSARRSAAATRT